MQAGFILYHYFKMGELYVLIRVFIAAYVWMTGFGNFCYFSRSQDFSFARLIKVLFRLNFLVCVVCVVLDREWMLYYVCALHTWAFLQVYVTMAICPSCNKSGLGVAVKLACLLIVLVAVFELPTASDPFLFTAVFRPFSMLRLHHSLHEWLFRASLDRYATWLGMCCAALLPGAAPLLAGYGNRIVKSCAVVTCLAVLVGWGVVWLPIDKYEYNRWHPFMSALPIVAFVVLRNLGFRTRYMALSAWVGKCTLETYVFQFHVWLSDDATTVVRWLPPHYSLVNFVVATTLFMLMAWTAFELTDRISSIVLPRFATITDRMLGMPSPKTFIGGCVTWYYHGSSSIT
jgi:hypothetical protein